MTDKLLKQLKKARWKFVGEVTIKGIRINNYFYCEPTLSDLIDACGDKFYGLQYNRGFKIKWMAEGYLDDDTIIGEAGNTPKEALIKL